MQENFLDELNEKQRHAATHAGRALLIIAGAGSGKTKTLAHRIAYFIRTGVPHQAIVAITFTNKAAEEMRERIHALLSNFPSFTDVSASGQSPFIGTFHSFCNTLLRAEAGRLGYTPSFTIFDEDDSLSLVKEIQKEQGLNPKQFPAGVLLHTISRAKSECIDSESFSESARGEFFLEKVALIYREYQKRIVRSNAMDFDDLIMNAVLVLERFPDIRAYYNGRFQCILVDEYQDTNIAQYRLIRLLSEKSGAVTVVGDDAQSIYSFRHADYRNILNFEKDWPNAASVTLDENYRSTQTILDAASDIISKNTLQKKKRLWTRRTGGGKIMIAEFQDERREAECIADTIREHCANGGRHRDCAVLYRTNAQSRIIEEKFLENDIPYTIVGGVPFHARREIKDILAYFRYALNERDVYSLKRIINIPPRKIGKQTLLKFLNASTLRRWEAENIRAFVDCIEWLKREIHDRAPSEAARALIKKISYIEYLEDATQDSDIREENIKEFISLASRYDHLKRPEGVAKLLENMSLAAEADTKQGRTDGVEMMTLHAAKGLEFPVVFIAGMEEGIFPHSRSQIDPAALEEERRLCYVGMTRAKDRLYLTSARRRMLFGAIQANLPSRFLSEISSEHIEHIAPDDEGDDKFEKYDDTTI